MNIRYPIYEGVYRILTEYSDYIAFVAIPDMGFTYGKIAYYSNGI